MIQPDNPRNHSQILRQSEEILKNALPPAWRLTSTYEPRRPTGLVDALFVISSPLGEQVTYVAEAKRQATTKNILEAVAQVRPAHRDR